jgi:2-succinyl-6-hydroxy-2,4-cyclohexadiene-1-carboxylate synthase
MRMKIKGVNYHIDIHGEGHPLVLLHGFTGATTTWYPFYQKWGQDNKIISIDIIGHGLSDSPNDSSRYQMLEVVEDLREVLLQLQIDKADFLGYSMGGRLALSFLIQHPQYVRKLVLESASPGLATEGEREERRKQDEKLATFIKNEGITRFIDYWGEIPLFSTQKKLPMDAQKQIKRQRLQNSEIGLQNSLIGMGTGSQPSLWNSLRNIEHDILIVTGSLDLKFCSIAEKMLHYLPQGQWIKVENCGHAIHVEKPEKFGTIVNEFLHKT